MAASDAAFLLYEAVCRMLEKIDVDGAYLLEKFLEIRKIMPAYIRITDQQEDDMEIEVDEELNSILKEAGISDEVFWSTFSETDDILNPQLRLIYELIHNNFDFSSAEGQGLLVYPQVMLLGSNSRKEINVVIPPGPQKNKNDEYDLSPFDRVFNESLRQQLSQRCGIFCPWPYKGQPCCGAKEILLRFYKRLPEEDRHDFKPPNCDLTR